MLAAAVLLCLLLQGANSGLSHEGPRAGQRRTTFVFANGMEVCTEGQAPLSPRVSGMLGPVAVA